LEFKGSTQDRAAPFSRCSFCAYMAKDLLAGTPVKRTVVVPKLNFRVPAHVRTKRRECTHGQRLHPTSAATKRDQGAVDFQFRDRSYDAVDFDAQLLIHRVDFGGEPRANWRQQLGVDKRTSAPRLDPTSVKLGAASQS
jgi:hypothetical protein